MPSHRFAWVTHPSPEPHLKEKEGLNNPWHYTGAPEEKQGDMVWKQNSSRSKSRLRGEKTRILRDTHTPEFRFEGSRELKIEGMLELGLKGKRSIKCFNKWILVMRGERCKKVNVVKSL